MWQRKCRRSYFYPRPPRGGRPYDVRQLDAVDFEFLSTPSARRATSAQEDVYIAGEISIHALREEGDWASAASSPRRSNFYPRPPRGGRRRAPSRWLLLLSISIHALREEGDTRSAWDWQRPENFYPRPPRGGRQQKQRQNLYFQTNYTTFCTNLEEP